MINIPIIFEDNHLLVVQKPPNVLSQGDKTGDADMLTILKEDIKVRYDKPGNVYLGLVHRLDRPVGGVMAFAKTSKAAARLSDQIRRGEFEKTYIAILRGVPPQQKDTLVHYLLKDNKTNMVNAVEKGVEGAKEAVLDYEVAGYVRGLTLVKVNLRTGRPHQIRVQFAAIGHPLYGDQRYGIRDKEKGQQIALWSYKISLEHPTLRKKMSFVSIPEKLTPWNKFMSLKLENLLSR